MRSAAVGFIAALVLICTPLAAGKAGDLDTSFDGDGKATTDFSGLSDAAFAVDAQRDGKLVVVGASGNDTSSSVAVARYTVSGMLDPAFDGDGRATASLTSTSAQYGYAVAVQPDGKILAAGTVLGTGNSLDFVLFRFNGNGSLDQSFDGDGKVATDFERGVDSASGMALQPDGKIVLAGITRPPGSGPFDIGVVRYNQDGSLDASFDGDGRVITPLSPGSDDDAHAVAVQPDGRIVAGGWSKVDQTYSGALVRYLPDGALDSSFDGDGKAIFSGSTSAVYALALQPDGKIVTVGESRFTVSRFNTDGSLDTSFGGDGNASSPFPPADGFAVAVQPDGKIVAAGGTRNDFAVARFKPGGGLDQGFGTGGSARADFGGFETAYGVALVPGSKIVVAGASGPQEGNGPYDFAVARFAGVTPAKPKPKKVTLCHKGRTIKVPKSAVKKHRKHGDKLGPCKTRKRR
jgi:uncharacterized delta-60 repeat protein